MVSSWYPRKFAAAVGGATNAGPSRYTIFSSTHAVATPVSDSSAINQLVFLTRICAVMRYSRFGLTGTSCRELSAISCRAFKTDRSEITVGV
jgi:hypothetical protein